MHSNREVFLEKMNLREKSNNILHGLRFHFVPRFVYIAMLAYCGNEINHGEESGGMFPSIALLRERESEFLQTCCFFLLRRGKILCLRRSSMIFSNEMRSRI